MKTSAKIVIVAVLAIAVVGASVVKKGKPSVEPESAAAPIESATPEGGSAVKAAKLPKLLDLGAGKCIPCKLMAPILDELKKDYAGKMDVDFIDVWKNPDAGKQYGIEMIPTQIFYDAGGNELFRHTGFFGREDILAKWKELGVDLSGKSDAAGLIRKTPSLPPTNSWAAVESSNTKPFVSESLTNRSR